MENAILHGLRHRADGIGKLIIAIDRNKDELICVIDDNGIGRRLSGLINKDREGSHQSLGLNVMEARIESMKLIYGNKQTVSIVDKPNDSGTIATISLPFINNCH